MFQDFELLSTMKSLICCVAQFQVAGYTPLEDLRKCTSERDSIIVDNFYTRNINKKATPRDVVRANKQRRKVLVAASQDHSGVADLDQLGLGLVELRFSAEVGEAGRHAFSWFLE